MEDTTSNEAGKDEAKEGLKKTRRGRGKKTEVSDETAVESVTASPGEETTGKKDKE